MSFQRFAKELYIASKLDHINIVKLEGFAMEENSPSLITLWAAGGTLNKYIKEHARCNLLRIVGCLPHVSETLIISIQRRAA